MQIKIRREGRRSWLLILEGKDKKELKSLTDAIKRINKESWEVKYREGCKAFEESQKDHDAVLAYLRDHNKT